MSSNSRASPASSSPCPNGDKPCSLESFSVIAWVLLLPAELCKEKAPLQEGIFRPGFCSFLMFSASQHSCPPKTQAPSSPCVLQGLFQGVQLCVGASRGELPSHGLVHKGRGVPAPPRASQGEPPSPHVTTTSDLDSSLRHELVTSAINKEVE